MLYFAFSIPPGDRKELKVQIRKDLRNTRVGEKTTAVAIERARKSERDSERVRVQERWREEELQRRYRRRSC